MAGDDVDASVDFREAAIEADEVGNSAKCREAIVDPKGPYRSICSARRILRASGTSIMKRRTWQLAFHNQANWATMRNPALGSPSHTCTAPTSCRMALPFARQRIASRSPE
jgi:hypothetical protein